MLCKITPYDEMDKSWCKGSILVTGCFDVLHVGHILLLEHADLLAEQMGGHVYVGLNSDNAVRALKGDSRPINTFADRARVIAACAYVDRVFEIDALRVDEAIRMLRPKVWLKGGDYTFDTLDKAEKEAAKEVGAEITIFTSNRHISTTEIIRKLYDQ